MGMYLKYFSLKVAISIEAVDAIGLSVTIGKDRP